MAISLIDEYIKYYNEYSEKYGKENTLVIMQVGSFYEMYATDVDGPDLPKISDLIGVVCTRRDKSIVKISKSNPSLVGFPVVAMQRHMNTLISNNYTVVVIDQIANASSMQRKVTNIVSPATFIENTISQDSNFVACIYISEELQKNQLSCICAGMSALDSTTGKSYHHEAISSLTDEKLALDEIVRFLVTVRPSETILYVSKLKKQSNTMLEMNKLISYLQLTNKLYYYKEMIDAKYRKPSFQNEFFKKVFPNTGIISPIEYLEFDRLEYCTLSFILLLDFVNDHNQKIICNLEKPKHFIGLSHMTLGNNAITQLDVINATSDAKHIKYNCLYDVLNKCSTALGRRLLQERLCSPSINIKDIQTYYDLTNALLENDLYKQIEVHLKTIGDIEKLTRKLSFGTLQPSEMVSLFNSYNDITIIIDIITNNEKFNIIKPSNETITNIKNMIEYLQKKLDFNELKKNILTDISSSFFNKGVYPDIDQLVDMMNNGHTFIDRLCETLTNMMDKEAGTAKNKKSVIHIKKNDRDGYFLMMSKIRGKLLKNSIADKKTINIDGTNVDVSKFIFQEQKDNIKLNIEHKTSDDIPIYKEKMVKLILKYWTELQNELCDKYNLTFRNINGFISKLDFAKCNAKNAKEYNYICPIIDEKSHGYIIGEQIRHPIIERLIEYEYIPHDIDLGNDLKGMLLYGLNSAGKSSVMKAIGLNIIMAQAGLFVAAKKFTYSTYNALYSRITGNDDLFKGLSSFGLEMIELKAILKRADPKMLVIGDEICRGTEHVSGNAIVASTVIMLSKSNSTFVFATHLHEIVQIEKVKNLKNVKPFHLSVEYDNETKQLIFDRLLKPGTGESIYGITVAKHLIHDNEFIELAIEIKNEITNKYNSLISGKTSKWNSDVFVYECQLCGKKDCPGTIGPLETHHINFQKDCINGFVKNKSHLQKDCKANLIVLCQECHDKIHNNEITVSGYTMTSDGVKPVTTSDKKSKIIKVKKN